MVFGFFKKKRGAPTPVDPLAAFDEVIASVERQAAEVRKSAATLLALRGELQRDAKKYGERLALLEERKRAAGGDARVQATLARDEAETRALAERTDEALSQAEGDARLLLETAEALGRQLQELQAERHSARVRLRAGAKVSEALQKQVAGFEALMKLDAARDEVERAHALAELYREEAKRRG